MGQVFNFSAGPAMLPQAVLQLAQQELLDWNDLGTSVMEVSHRGKPFIAVAEEAEANLRTLLQIPANYRVLFCHGGARGQFAAIPLNLRAQHQQADYITSGYWSEAAVKEAQQYIGVNASNVIVQNNGLRAIKPMSQWQLSEQADYIHYCPNETIDGVAIHEQPDFKEAVVVADLSSVILSAPLDVSRYGLIYAGAQKNIGPAGITIVIVRDDLLARSQEPIPSIFNYAVLDKHDSMFNTPPTFAWYLSGLVFKWLLQQGGVAAMAEKNQAKAALLYQAIDNSDFYANHVALENRSLMNVPFKLADDNLNDLFLQEANQAGLRELKGHRIVGGMRASIYNAMPLEGVQALVDFMQAFEKKHG